VFDYIEKFYNLRRRHSTLDYLSPAQFEQQAGMC
jgi:putative transposase